ncbi:4'-phosphopantetheinyl transferase superfamily protein [Exilibacterium tricleocarpae]|uniref:Enterobactin synthase component D n=1 Tax=Exilibacterium tricleocarpae TaxID=2591008 RepID=A0A545SSR1_9GAMM|nr:4'-phosphopantetheinyl transferase superfamily protein [Exilibacterium tricleocarpae]TQV68003.1 4'-phosphopantetheinyl transferase superfamily protein [Exilibacterium tricleocarpae]
MLYDISFTPPVALAKIGYCGCHFRPEQFTEFAFERYGVHQPATLFNAVAKRKSEFLAGRYCSSRALVNVFGTDSRIDINPDRSPKWPHGVVGSITHSKDRAAAIVASDKEYIGLGIDFEKLMAFPQAQELQHQILADQDLECEELRQCGTGFFITLAFSAKESLYKALYPTTQQYMEFQDLYIKRVGTNAVTLSLLKTLNSNWQCGTDFEILYAKYDDEIFTMACLENALPAESTRKIS